MLYKTIALELLQDHPAFYDRLRANRTALLALERLAIHLKQRHQEWTQTLSRTQPGRSPEPIQSEALELAIQELRDSLSNASPQDEEDFSLDAALAFLARPTPPA